MNAVDTMRFLDRREAGHRVGEALRDRPFRNPLVLGIPRGGVVTAAAVAEELNAELDVVLARKLRAPSNPEYAIGAVAEDGRVTINPEAHRVIGVVGGNLEAERVYQFGEITRRKKMIRAVRPKARVAGRSVIVTDDGIATGSTMIAALQAVRAEKPYELIVAVPVASPERLEVVRQYCDEAVSLLTPEDFWAVGQFYQQFEQVEDEEVLRLLQGVARKT
jgi:predicted phosphoribosyltransferase